MLDLKQQNSDINMLTLAMLCITDVWWWFQMLEYQSEQSSCQLLRPLVKHQAPVIQ